MNPLQNRDILFEIVLRLDNETLSALVLSTLWPILQLILRDNNWWYQRTELLFDLNLESRPDTEWRRVYRSAALTLLPRLSLENKPEEGDTLFWRELDYLPTVFVLEEALGAPDWVSDEEEQWRELLSMDVLHYLVEKEYLTLSEQNLAITLDRVAEKGIVEMVKPLLEEIEEQLGEDVDYEYEEEVHSWIEESLHIAAQAGHLPIVKLLQEYLPAADRDDLLEQAIEGGHMSVIEYAWKCLGTISGLRTLIKMMRIDLLPLLLDREESQIDSERSLRVGIEEGSPEVIEIMLSRDSKLRDTIEWDWLLLDAIRADQVALVEYALKQDLHLAINSQVLSLARSKRMFELLLDDPRADVSDIDKLLSSTPIYSYSVAHLLLASPKLRVEKLTPEEVRLLLRYIKVDIRDKIEGFNLAVRLVTRSNRQLVREQAQKRAEGDDIYSLVLRFILLKSPTSLELVHWMIDLRDRSLVLAARTLLEAGLISGGDATGREGDTLTPLRALMTCLLYPSLTVSDLISDMRDEQASMEELLLSIELVGVYYGKSKITQQARVE